MQAMPDSCQLRHTFEIRQLGNEKSGTYSASAGPACCQCFRIVRAATTSALLRSRSNADRLISIKVRNIPTARLQVTESAVVTESAGMFRHILIPTDGSERSLEAIENGIRLASELGARVTGYHATQDFAAIAYRAEMLEVTREHYMAQARLRATTALDEVRHRAKLAGVECDVESTAHEHPHRGIIESAERNGCDLILMASHGRKGIQGLLLGSETQKVLTHSKIPVLVYR